MTTIRIPADLGRRLPGRAPVVAPPVLNQTARAMSELGGTAFGIAADMRAQQTRQEAQERDAAERSRATLSLGQGELRLRETSTAIGERVLGGTLSEQEAQRELSEAATNVVAEQVKDLPPDMRDTVGNTLRLKAQEFGLTVVGRAAKQRVREETRANVVDSVEVLERSAFEDRPKAITRLHVLLDMLGPAAGFGPDDRQRIVQGFKERTSLNAARILLRNASADPALLDAAAAEINTDAFADLTPEHRERLEAEVIARKQHLEHQARAAENRARIEADRQETEAYGTALLQVETQGRVDRELFVQLSDAHRASILNRQKAEGRAREGKVKTDWPLYLNLREQAVSDPKGFAAVDLKEYVDRLQGAQLEQLVDLKAKIITGVGKAPRDAVSLTQQMNATMASLGITKASTKGKFITYVQQAVDAETHAKGKALTFDERQRVIDEATLKGPDPDAWLWGDKRVFELTPEQRARFRPNPATDAPATEVDALNDALRQQGLPLTAANRLRLYERATKGSQ